MVELPKQGATCCWLVLLPFSPKVIRMFAVVLLLLAHIAGSKRHLLGISTGRAGLLSVSLEPAVLGDALFTLQCWLFHRGHDGTWWQSFYSLFILFKSRHWSLPTLLSQCMRNLPREVVDSLDSFKAHLDRVLDQLT